MIRRFEKSHPVRDPELRATWRAEQDRCAACGRILGRFYGGRWWIEGHHIIKPGRSDERCNLLPLCAGFLDDLNRCHDLAEGHRIRRADKTLWPTLSLANCLWLKRETDPDHWDPERLSQLLHRPLPEPERPSEIFFDLRREHT